MPVRRTPFTVPASFNHVGKFEPGNPQFPSGNTDCGSFHEFRVHWRHAVGQNDGGALLDRKEIQLDLHRARLNTHHNANQYPDQDQQEQTANTHQSRPVLIFNRINPRRRIITISRDENTFSPRWLVSTPDRGDLGRVAF